MKLVIGSYVLDGVSSTAYEQFITYYQNTPASYITNQDIERWNTPADLSDLASKSYVMDKIGAIPAPDLSPYATVSYVTDNFIEIEKSIASAVSYVNNKVDNIDIPEPDLSSYATQSYVMEKVQNISVEVDTTGFVDETRLQDYVSGAIAAHNSTAQNNWQSYTTSNINALNISSYATKDWVTEHITEIATGGTVTLDGYATELWVNNQGFLKSHQSLANYVTSSILSATLNSYMKKSDMSSYATQEWVNTAILNAAVGEVDLSNYALKSEIPSLNNYYSKTWIDSNFASKDYVTERIANVSSGGTVSLDGYATENWVTNHFLGNSALGNYYTKSQVDAKIPSLTNYITFDWIEGYYNQYVKDYCDTFNTDGTNLLNYISKEELDGLSYVTTDYLSSLGYITQHQSLDDYISKTDLNNLSYATVSYVTDNLIEVEKAVASAVSYVNNKIDSIGSIVIPEVDLSSYATISYITDKFAEDESVWAAALTDINTRMGSYVTQDALSVMGYLTQHQDLSNYPTKSDINNYSYISWKNMNPGSYTGNITLYRNGLFINENNGHITPTVFSYEQIASSGNYNWVSSGSLKNYISGVLSSYVTLSSSSNPWNVTYINEMYLSYNSNLTKVSYELWTFQLADNSYVTKKILLF